MTQPTGPPVRWPKIKAYREAVQAPEFCFADADLRKAVIHKAAGGFPQIASGRSAVVFKATVETRTIAIRCFTRAASDQEQRYRALQAYIGELPPPYLVRFAYRDQEIWVENGRYPLVEMDWVEGRPLNEWVCSHLGEGRDLIDQAAAWLFMAGDMLSRRLAHGDIANDNCLVTGSQLKLIDYDGCYLPGLSDKHPGESGAQHFQHPRRNGHYAGDMDAFPTLVVFLSLLALHDDPSLWKRFYTDKNLIFHDADFQAPGQTPIWSVLAASQDPWVRQLTTALAGMCRAPVDGLPTLPQVTQRAGIQLSREAPWTLDREVAVSAPAPLPWWQQAELTERLRRRPAAGQPAGQQAGPLPDTNDNQPTVPIRPTAPTPTAPVPLVRPTPVQPVRPTPVQPVRPAPSPPVKSPRRRHPVAFALLIILAVLAALIVIGLLTGS
jgi:hypothetical protein